MFITASDFWSKTSIKSNSTIDVFPRSLTNLVRALFLIILYNGCLYVKGFYNLMSVFALKNSCKTFWKSAENPGKATF